MKVRNNFMMESETLNELRELSKKTRIRQCQILELSLKYGMQKIRELNKDFTDFIDEVK